MRNAVAEMSLRKLPRNPIELGVLSLFADGPDGARDLNEDGGRRQFLKQLGEGFDETLANQARMHGWRAQALFRSLVVELAGVKIFKSEDDGSVYFDDAEGKIKVPDFRAVLADGSTLLIEVKNVAPGQASASISVGELEGLRRYGDTHGARTLVAQYWTIANAWTLVDLKALKVKGRRAEIGIREAMKASEMSRLGDALLGTVPPLVFRLHADSVAPATVRKREAGNSVAEFTVGSVELSAAGKTLDDPEEVRLAMAMMFFGRWEMDDEIEIENGRVEALSYVFTPAQETPGQGFEIVASLSSICSASYNLATLEDDGTVARLQREPTPGALADLVPDDYWSQDRGLRLWKFNLVPPETEEPVATAT